MKIRAAGHWHIHLYIMTVLSPLLLSLIDDLITQPVATSVLILPVATIHLEIMTLQAVAASVQKTLPR